jgi:hypothetical protein
MSDGELEEALGASSSVTSPSEAAKGPRTLSLQRGEHPPRFSSAKSGASTPKRQATLEREDVTAIVAATKPQSKSKYETAFLNAMSTQLYVMQADTNALINQARAGVKASHEVAGELALVRKTTEMCHSLQLNANRVINAIMDSISDEAPRSSRVPSLTQQPPSIKRRRSGSSSNAKERWEDIPGDETVTLNPAIHKAFTNLHDRANRTDELLGNIVAALNTSTANQTQLIEEIHQISEKLQGFDRRTLTQFHSLDTHVCTLQGSVDNLLEQPPRPKFDANTSITDQPQPSHPLSINPPRSYGEVVSAINAPQTPSLDLSQPASSNTNTDPFSINMDGIETIASRNAKLQVKLTRGILSMENFTEQIQEPLSPSILRQHELRVSNELARISKLTGESFILLL